MATFAHHGSLVAGTPSGPVILTNTSGGVEVINRTGTDEIFFTVNGQPPTIGGDDTYIVPAMVGAYSVPVRAEGEIVVQLISATVQNYSVIGGPTE